MKSLPLKGGVKRWPHLSAVIMAFVCVTTTAVSAPSAQNLFLWQQANAHAMRASGASDYLDTALAYNTLALAGVRNGPLFYNLGTTLLRARKYEEAFYFLVRAERYMGADPDLRRNMSLAFAEISGAPAPSLPWSRLALFWHYGLSSKARWNIALTSFLLWWLCMMVSVFKHCKSIARIQLAALALMIVFGTSSLTTIYQEMNARRIILEPPKPQDTASSAQRQ